MRFKDLSIQPKLIGLMLLISLIPLVCVSFWTYQKSSDALKDDAYRQLTAVRSIKSNQINGLLDRSNEDLTALLETVETIRQKSSSILNTVLGLKLNELENFYDQYSRNIELLASSKEASDLYARLVEYHHATGVTGEGAYDVNTPAYKEIYQKYGARINEIAKIDGFTDVLMMCAAHGHVMFSSAKRADLGTNLRYGPYKNSVLHKLWQKVLDSKKLSIVDFEPYAANGNLPTAYIGIPM